MNRSTTMVKRVKDCRTLEIKCVANLLSIIRVYVHKNVNVQKQICFRAVVDKRGKRRKIICLDMQ